MTPRSALARRTFPFAAAVVGVLAAGILVPMLRTIIERDFKLSDYGWHFEAARRTWEQGRLVAPHFLYHLLVLGMKLTVPSLDWWTAGLVVVIVFYLATASMLLWLCLENVVIRSPVVRAILAVGMTLGLMVAAPVSVVTWGRHSLYHGYIGINVYHSPTVIVLKPLALWLFLLIVRLMARGEWGHFGGNAFGLAASGVLSTLAKPNYTLCLLPAVGLLAVLDRTRGRRVAWGLFSLAVAAPAAAVLLWQYRIASEPVLGLAGSTKLVVAPFVVMGNHADRLLFRFLLSILFPSIVYFLYLPRAARSRALRLAWATFAVSLVFAYGLAESGGRALNANLLWGSQVALFILFVVSACLMARWASRGLRAGKGRRVEATRLTLCLSGFALHTASGLMFYRHPLWW
jgi:hypothetical protein